MRRWAINILCGLSLLIFAASVVVWVRSYFMWEDISRFNIWSELTAPPLTGARFYHFGWSLGTFAIGYTVHEETRRPWTKSQWIYRGYRAPRHNLLLPPWNGDVTNFHVGQFQLCHRGMTDQSGWWSQWTAVVPMWIFLPTAIPPLLWWRRHRRNRGRGFPVTMANPSEDSRPA